MAVCNNNQSKERNINSRMRWQRPSDGSELSQLMASGSSESADAGGQQQPAVSHDIQHSVADGNQSSTDVTDIEWRVLHENVQVPRTVVLQHAVAYYGGGLCDCPFFGLSVNFWILFALVSFVSRLNCKIRVPNLMPVNDLRKQEVKVIWQKAPHGGPIPRLGVTPWGRNLYHWIPGVGVPISVS